MNIKITLLIIFLFYIFSNTLIACECIEMMPKSKNNYIFRGHVESIKKINDPYIRYEINFKVDKWIKGKLKSNKIIVNVQCLNVAYCGFEFELKKSFEVYTYKEDNLNFTSSCTYTHDL